jgi:hypothetical protein
MVLDQTKIGHILLTTEKPTPPPSGAPRPHFCNGAKPNQPYDFGRSGSRFEQNDGEREGAHSTVFGLSSRLAVILEQTFMLSSRPRLEAWWQRSRPEFAAMMDFWSSALTG